MDETVRDEQMEQAIRRYLERDCPDLRCLREIDSTNSYLKREALLSAPHGTVVIADRQSAGRGRMGRSFLSPPDRGVYLSVLLRPQLPAAALMGVTGMAAVAVCDAVERAAGVRPGIKWTNDLVLRGRKLGGILTEMTLDGDETAAASLVVGVGINVSHMPEDFSPDVAEIATSLKQEGYDVPRAALAAAMIGAFYRLADELGGDSGTWVEAYRRDCVTLGREVRLLWSAQQEKASALDIDEQFGLVVQRENGEVTTVRTGEVSVRGLYGYAE